MIDTECPCSEESEENCEDCQDLPRGTLQYWRELELQRLIEEQRVRSEIVESQVA